jgi:hypothetical protein
VANIRDCRRRQLPRAEQRLLRAPRREIQEKKDHERHRDEDADESTNSPRKEHGKCAAASHVRRPARPIPARAGRRIALLISA